MSEEVFNPQHHHLVLSLQDDLKLNQYHYLGAMNTKDLGKVEEIVNAGKAMLVNLVHALGMVPVTTPQVAYVTVAGNEGPTGSINLATSHIAFHYWAVDGRLEMDIYSCKPFEDRLPEVTKLITDYFGPMWGKAGWLDRETHTVREIDYDPADHLLASLDYSDFKLGVE